MMSDEPPGGYGTMMWTGLVGNALGCAKAAGAPMAAAPVMSAWRRVMGRVMACLLCLFLLLSRKRERESIASSDHARPLRVELPSGHQELHRDRIVAGAQA